MTTTTFRCRAAGLLTLATFMVAGCRSESPAPRIDPVIEQAVKEYWSAVGSPDWGPNQQGQPNWKQAYDMLHDEAKSQITLEQFNQQQFHRLVGKDGPLFRVRVEDATISGDVATVHVTLHFGDPARPGQPIRVVTELRRSDTRWSVVATSEL